RGEGKAVKSGYITLAAAPAVVASTMPAFAQRVDHTAPFIQGRILAGMCLAFFGLYFAPTIIAFRKNHINKWLYLLVNIVLGITVVGWLILLVLVHLDIYIENGKIINNARSANLK